MDCRIIAVGKTGSSYLNQGIETYLGRLKHYIPTELVAIPDIKGAAKMPEEEQKRREGAAALAALSPGDYLILLDERGCEMTSEQFAEHIQGHALAGRKRIVFMIGGPYGFSREVYDRADGMIALSKMTMTHEMVRLLLVEQIYRACTIMRGEKYHHR